MNKMAAIYVLMLAVLSLTNPSTANLFDLVGNVTVKALGDLGELVDGTQSTGVTAVSDQCTTLKTAMTLQGQLLNQTAQEPDVSKLTIDYITRDTFEMYNINSAAEEIPKSNWFNPDQGLMAFVHGFTDNANKSNYRNMSDEFLARGPTNIVALNSSALIGSQYLRSTEYVPYIGRALGKVLYSMYQAGMNASSMYLIGHSLGAHISGYAGKYFEKLSGVKVARITGLDPAGPCFTSLNSSLRLNSSDAVFVDTIHSNAGVFGLDEDLGHLNFSPNGGSTQPGCPLADCSHGRAVLFFTESINSPSKFVAVACNSWRDFREGRCNSSDTTLMGYGASNATSGSYFLQTSASSPFGLGAKGTTYF